MKNCFVVNKTRIGLAFGKLLNFNAYMISKNTERDIHAAICINESESIGEYLIYVILFTCMRHGSNII